MIFLPSAALADTPNRANQDGDRRRQRGASGARRPLAIGDHVFRSDTVVTGERHGRHHVRDNSMMSAGAVQRLSPTSLGSTRRQNGVSITSLQKGHAGVKSGQIVRQTPEAMRVRTPAALLGVRGTEFVVSADDVKP